MSLLFKIGEYLDNKKKVLQTIFNENGVSRNDIVDKTGLSLISVTKFVSSLLSDGVIIEQGVQTSTGGRKANNLIVNGDYCYIIGIDIGSFSSKIGVVKFDGELVFRKDIAADMNFMPSIGMSFDILIAEIENIFNEFEKEKFAAISVGISGMVNHDEGKIVFCPNIAGWNNVDIVSELKAKFNLPTFVDTSARCMALSEKHFGIGKGIANQIFVTLSYSIGAGIIVNSEIFRGSQGFAGELGHIQADDTGLQCSCGNYDCLELYATLPLIVTEVQNRLKEYSGYSPLLLDVGNVSKIDKEALTKAIENDDKVTFNVLVDTGKRIGIALSTIINIMNPSAIILGGVVIESFPLLVDEIEREIKKRILSPMHSELIVKKSVTGENSPIIGASLLAINEFIK